MNSFFNAQFNYCPLIWMLHSRCNNSSIRHLHERCLRLAYNDKRSSYENVQDVAIEMFKVKNSGLAPNIFHDNETENHYNLNHRTEFRIPFFNSVYYVYYGSESISCLGPNIWDIVHSEFKQIESLNGFKISIKKWIIAYCLGRLRRSYISGVGFI